MESATDTIQPVSGESMADQVVINNFVNTVLTITKTLQGFESLKPGTDVNKTFAELVTMCCQTLSTATTGNIMNILQSKSILPSLNDLCGHGESELESYWARKVSAESDPTRAVEVMKSFPYYQNYMDLTRMELCAMYAVEPNKPKSIAFLGSGSWPMTSLALLDLLRNGIVFGEQTTVTTGKNEMTIMNFDRDQKCIQESRAFCRAIGSQADGMEFCCADARNLPRDLTDFDVVYLAALVGSTAEEKAKMVNYVAQQMRVGALMIIRSVQGLKKCLYQELDPTSPLVLERLDIGAVLHPFGQVVNSAIVARVKAKSYF